MFTTEISRSEMQHSVNLVDLDQRFGSDIRYIRLGRSREQAVSSSASISFSASWMVSPGANIVDRAEFLISGNMTQAARMGCAAMRGTTCVGSLSFFS